LLNNCAFVGQSAKWQKVHGTCIKIFKIKYYNSRLVWSAYPYGLRIPLKKVRARGVIVGVMDATCFSVSGNSLVFEFLSHDLFVTRNAPDPRARGSRL